MAWFKDWFGTPYYKLLYSHRDEDEAERLIDKLLEKVDLKPGSRILDAGCGRGRHAVYLAQKGYEVVGIDISAVSIASAKKFEHEHLQFICHDMRLPLPVRGFDLVMNLFTSFGYFDNAEEDAMVVENWCKSLKPGGCLIIDFLNAEHVRNSLVAEETVVKEDVTFYITRTISDEFVHKGIRIIDEEGTKNFSERVKLLRLEDFKAYFAKACFDLENIFGDYELGEYDLKDTPRLILQAKKR